ncbi:hypothetical protein EVAR_95263_1 [Eumeta japonica]|uniref:Uncharacterized protein n=1 Tax=Eumeta variegata TaxID=151549 RepID=A0A4C1UJY5_EUMVA|nr:hypothetical protein EVAR_95263_1 [Eumeta japonica]
MDSRNSTGVTLSQCIDGLDRKRICYGVIMVIVNISRFTEASWFTAFVALQTYVLVLAANVRPTDMTSAVSRFGRRALARHEACPAHVTTRIPDSLSGYAVYLLFLKNLSSHLPTNET